MSYIWKPMGLMRQNRTEAYMVNDLEGLLEDINKFHPIAYILSVKQSELERIAICKINLTFG
jgi:hypothetical protein